MMLVVMAAFVFVARQFNRSYLLTDQTSSPRLEAVSHLEGQGLWQEGDVVLPL